MKRAAHWKRTSLHPLEYHAEHNGCQLIVRTLRQGDQLVWEAVSHRDTKPVAKSVHHTYFEAVAWAEAVS